MEDLQKFELDTPFADFNNTMITNLLDSSKDITSLHVGDKVIAFAGINHLRLGVVEAWVIRGKGIDDNKFEFFKKIKGLIDFVFEFMSVHRFEIAIDNEWDKGHKWARTLGLELEHICKAYDHFRKDHAIYVRIG